MNICILHDCSIVGDDCIDNGIDCSVVCGDVDANNDHDHYHDIHLLCLLFLFVASFTTL